MSPSPRVAVLGPVLVEGPEGDLTPVSGALARAFLVALVLARGHTMTTEALIDELWEDEPPKGARAALQTLVSRLRRSVADGLVRSTATGYALAVATDDTDLGRAERTAAGTDHDRTRVSAALELWRGDPGAHLEGALAEALADRADAVRRGLRRALGDALLAAGDAAPAVDLWQAEAAANPFDELAVDGLMRALEAAGRTAEALAVFAAHRDRLADELGADPAAALVRRNAELLRRSSAPVGAPRRIGLRVAPNAMVGREADLAAVAELLSASRLVTILGAGGLGKTRLAQAVAASVPAACGVVVVELAPLTSGEDVVAALGALLGIAEVRTARSLRDGVVADLRDRVVRALGEEPTVLVLDNCEHVVAEVADLVSELLAGLPELRVLTTSRAPLAIAGEVVAPLAPLPVEADGAAVRLFTDRARAARPGAVLPVDAVRRICTRLDGSPLAIELAAARIRGMGVDEIERRLDDRFALLRGGDRTAPERHRTLLAVIEWSWRLLDDGARDLLPRLALFPDGLSVAAVEAVASPERREDALDDLAELVEQSLVQLVEHEGEPVRYRLLETVREFGAARLAEHGTTAAVRAAMLDWGRAFGAAHNLFTIRGAGQLPAFREVAREADNLVTLLRWALQDEDRTAAAHVFAALGGYWTLRGAHGEVLTVAVDLVAVLRAAEPTPSDRAAVVLGLVVAGASTMLTDRRTAVRARSALRRAMRAGSTGARVLDAQAALFLTIGRPASGAALLAELRDDPDDGVAGLANMLSAPLAENDGESGDALRFALRGEELARRAGDVWTTGTSAVSTMQLAAQAGRYAEALAASEVARDRLEQFGAEDDLYEIGWTIGLCAAAVGDVDRALRIAADLDDRPRTGTPGFDGDRAQRGVLGLGIRAEAARASGDPARGAREYGRAWAFVLPHRHEAGQWTLMTGAALLAAEHEAAGHEAAEHEAAGPDAAGHEAAGHEAAGHAAGVGAPDGADPGLPAGDARPDLDQVARRIRVGALVMLRLHPWWLDLPVVGTAALGLALHGAATAGDPDLVARAWGLACRFGSRQDFAVLAHTRVRPLVAAHVGEERLRDAETAPGRWDRSEAVVQARAVFEALRAG